MIKRSKSKLLVLLAFVTVFAILLGSCGAGSGGSKKEITLYFWCGVPEAFGPRQTMDAYTAKNPNVKFEFVQLAWDEASDTKLVTALMGNDGVDIYMPTRAYINKAEQGVAQDLTDFLSKNKIDLFKDLGADASTYQYNGKFHSIPVFRSAVYWMLNMDMFEAAGVPLPDDSWTVDDLMEIARKLTKGSGADKVYGAYITSNWGAYFSALTNGFADSTDQWSEDMKSVKFTVPVSLDFLKKYLIMTDVDKSMPTYSECVAEGYMPNQMLLTEKAAMVYTGSYVLRDVKNREKYPHTFKTAFAMPPLDPAYNKKLYQAGLQDPIMINPKTKYMDECYKFLKWFYDEGMENFIPGGRTPANVNYPSANVAEKFVAGYEDIIDKASFERVLKADRKPMMIYQGVDVNEVGMYLVQEFEEAAVGNKTPEQALADAQDRADKYLAGK